MIVTASCLFFSDSLLRLTQAEVTEAQQEAATQELASKQLLDSLVGKAGLGTDSSPHQRKVPSLKEP